MEQKRHGRFRTIGYLLSGAALMIQRTFPLNCEAQPLRIIEIIDVGCENLLNFRTCA